MTLPADGPLAKGGFFFTQNYTRQLLAAVLSVEKALRAYAPARIDSLLKEEPDDDQDKYASPLRAGRDRPDGVSEPSG